MNIIFAGTPEFGLPCLNALSQSSHQIIAVYTQPDRPAGRGQKLYPSAIKSWAIEHEIPVYQPLNFREQEALDSLAALKPDLMIVVAYGIILPKKVLSIPRLGCINVHASLLPRWRGASPIQQAILHGDEKTGITIMQMNVGMDTGPSLAQVTCPIYPDDTSKSLHDRLAESAAAPLLTSIQNLENGTVVLEPQDESQVTYAPKINKQDDAKINWEKPAVEINNQIRAFNPWPIAYTLIGEDALRVIKARVVSRDIQDNLHTEDQLSTIAAGTILALDKKGILVKAGEGALMIEWIQFPGSRAMPVSDWLNAGRTQLHINLRFQ